MDDFWTTRSGRWRIRLARDFEGPLEARLYRLICADIHAHLLPTGAVLPAARRVASELGLEEAEVARAYDALLADGFLEDRDGAGLHIAPRQARDDAQARRHEPGADTQVRFEQRLLDLARRAAADGKSVKDASGAFSRLRDPDDAGSDR